MVSKGNHSQIALFQVSEILYFTQIYTIEAPSSPLVSLRWMGQRNPIFTSNRMVFQAKQNLLGYINHPFQLVIRISLAHPQDVSFPYSK